MIVLTEAAQEPGATGSARDLAAAAEAAHLAGCRIYHIPKDFRECETAENALWHVPEQPAATPAVWLGFIPGADRYEAIFEAALRRNIHLLNNPGEHLVAQEFHLAYPRLEGITPESRIVSHADEAAGVVEQLGLPLFVRGTARSRKSAGWKACVASTPQELQTLIAEMLENTYRSRGRVIVRKLVDLRHARYSDQGFPLGREYRIFLYRGQVLKWGYYWEGDDPLADLSAEEEQQMLSLATEAAVRLAVPFVAIDIGQQVDGHWIVIEANDAQFAGMASIPPLALWNRIASLEST